MIKLVVADFDGTLLPYGEKRVSENTIKYIKELTDKGIDFAVASGRTYSELKALLSEVADDIYFICDDGALTVKNKKVVFKKQFNRSALNVFLDGDIFSNATFYSLDKAYLFGINPQPVLYGKTPCKISRLIEIKDDVFKITANAKCFDLVDSSHFRVHYSEGKFAEFVTPFANKGVAIADLQLKLGISKFETVAIGDADNDIPMMQHAKYSWCIGDRSQRLSELTYSKAETAEFVIFNIINNMN